MVLTFPMTRRYFVTISRIHISDEKRFPHISDECSYCPVMGVPQIICKWMGNVGGRSGIGIRNGS